MYENNYKIRNLKYSRCLLCSVWHALIFVWAIIWLSSILALSVSVWTGPEAGWKEERLSWEHTGPAAFYTQPTWALVSFMSCEVKYWLYKCVFLCVRPCFYSTQSRGCREHQPDGFIPWSLWERVQVCKGERMALQSESEKVLQLRSTDLIVVVFSLSMYIYSTLSFMSEFKCRVHLGSSSFSVTNWDLSFTKITKPWQSKNIHTIY